MAFKSIIGMVLCLLAVNANAAVIHTYEFGNTANGGPDSGTLTFSSEGTPAAPSFIEFDFGDMKATINGTYYDFSNLTPPGGGWTQIAERNLYDFTSTTSRILLLRTFVKGDLEYKYHIDFSFFDEPTGFGIGALWLPTGISSFPGTVDEDYAVEVAYLHTTSPVPIPAAVWLFGSGLFCLIGATRRKASE